MIRPTLFVGLGTTGVKILRYLRRMVFEEYARPGLPIFRYIGIETDQGERGEDPELPASSEPYENLRVINAVIANTQTIKGKIDQNDRRYNKHLARWLPSEILDIPGNQFTTGASSIRIGGRLCLWENWKEGANVSQVLKQSKDAIIAPDNIALCKRILEQYLIRKGGKKEDFDIAKAVNIYIVGSLCGGTCGGMIIDVAYYFRDILGLWNVKTFDDIVTPQIYGIFTMLDYELTKKYPVLAANCYASLLELDFYNHPQSTYSITYPDGSSTGEQNDSPFDYITIVSPTGKNPNISFIDSAGGLDEEGLNQMAAMNIFADVIGDISKDKNEIRTDWRSEPNYNRPKEGSNFTRSLATFGASTVWYPKYRIAGAAACLFAKGLCERWIGTCDKNRVEKEAKDAWNIILGGKIGILTTPSSGLPLRARINDLLSRRKADFLRMDSTTLRQTLRAFPPDDSFANKFSRDGEYYNLIANQIAIFVKELSLSVKDKTNELINRIIHDEKTNLDAISYFLEVLDKEIESAIRRCPDDVPIFSFPLIILTFQA